VLPTKKEKRKTLELGAYLAPKHECLLSKHEALSSNPSTTKKRKKEKHWNKLTPSLSPT
jgi:hypothetical protein